MRHCDRIGTSIRYLRTPPRDMEPGVSSVMGVRLEFFFLSRSRSWSRGGYGSWPIVTNCTLLVCVSSSSFSNAVSWSHSWDVWGARR